MNNSNKFGFSPVFFLTYPNFLPFHTIIKATPTQQMRRTNNHTTNIISMKPTP